MESANSTSTPSPVGGNATSGPSPTPEITSQGNATIPPVASTPVPVPVPVPSTSPATLSPQPTVPTSLPPTPVPTQTAVPSRTVQPTPIPLTPAPLPFTPAPLPFTPAPLTLTPTPTRPLVTLEPLAPTTTPLPTPTVEVPRSTAAVVPFSPAFGPTSGGSDTGKTIGIVAGGVLGVLVLLVAMVMGLKCLMKTRGRRGTHRGPTLPLAKLGFPDLSAPRRQSNPSVRSKTEFSFDELSRATDGFHESRLLGAGGFGKVYRGELQNGTTVAIKFSLVQGPDEIGEREFQSELEVVSRVHHKHLVSFLGYASEEDKRLLVLQFMPNGTLSDRIHAPKSLDWAGRLRAAVGAARGLAYLHEDCRPAIIHRDIKSSNILMDANMDARVADFGISKLREDSYVNTHVSTRVIGTFGYLDPAYANTGRLTVESDTYSFGVVLLEIVTGRSPVDNTRRPGEESLVAWSRPLIEEGGYFGIMDPFLMENGYDKAEVRRMIKTAWLCTQPLSHARPNMSQVLRYLEGNAQPSSPVPASAPARTILDNELFRTGR